MRPARAILFSSHPFCVDFPLNDFVRRLARQGHWPSELLTTTVTVEVPIREVLRDAFDETLDQSASSALAVFVKQCPAFGAVYGYRSTADLL